MHKKQLLLCNWWSAGGSGAHGHGLAVRQACRLQNHLPWGDIPGGGHGGGRGSRGICIAFERQVVGRQHTRRFLVSGAHFDRAAMMRRTLSLGSSKGLYTTVSKGSAPSPGLAPSLGS